LIQDLLKNVEISACQKQRTGGSKNAQYFLNRTVPEFINRSFTCTIWFDAHRIDKGGKILKFKLLAIAMSCLNIKFSDFKFLEKVEILEWESNSIGELYSEENLNSI